MNWRSLAAAAWVTGGAGGLVSCSAQGEKALQEAAPRAPPRPAVLPDPLSEEYQPAPLPHGRVILTDTFGLRRTVEVAVAADEPSRNRGLMWRRELKEGAGMLFVFGEERIQNFYMRNTLIPLDMIFIGKDRKIVGIVARAEPKSWTPRGVGKPSLYVLEVSGGWAEKLGLKAGDSVELEGVTPSATTVR